MDHLRFEHSMDEQAWAMFAAAALVKTISLNAPEQAAKVAAQTADHLLLQFRARGRQS